MAGWVSADPGDGRAGPDGTQNQMGPGGSVTQKRDSLLKGAGEGRRVPQ